MQGGGRGAGSGRVEPHHLRLYGGMDVSEAQEAKQLRDENTKLRKPDAAILQTAQQAGHCGVEAACDYLKGNDPGLSLPRLDV